MVSAFKKLSQIIALGALRSDFVTALRKTESCFAEISPSVTTRYLPMPMAQNQHGQGHHAHPCAEQ